MYPLGLAKSPVLVVDLNRLFEETLFGRRVTAQFNAATSALQSENDRIKASLDAEERNLADRRPAMSAEEFSAAAEDFDARVRAIRAEQAAKEIDLNKVHLGERVDFVRTSRPIREELMRRAGAVVMLDTRFVLATSDFEWLVAEQLFIRAPRPIYDELTRRTQAVVGLDRPFVFDQIDAIDVTDAVVDEIDARIGDGSTFPVPPDGPSETGPDDEEPVEPAPAP